MPPALGFESPCPHHVGASFLSLAPTFFQKVGVRSFRCSSFPNRIRCAGFRFGYSAPCPSTQGTLITFLLARNLAQQAFSAGRSVFSFQQESRRSCFPVVYFTCSAAPPKNKKCVSPKPSGLTHFCYTIFPSNFLPFFHISPDSMKKAHGGSATGFTQNRHTLWAYYIGFTEKFQMVLFTNFTCRTRSILEYNSSALLTN